MPSEARSPRLAVLIDADNASEKIADGLFEEIAEAGIEVSLRSCPILMDNRRGVQFIG